MAIPPQMEDFQKRLVAATGARNGWPDRAF